MTVGEGRCGVYVGCVVCGVLCVVCGGIYGIYNIPVPGFRNAILEFSHSDHAQSPGNPELVTISHPVHRWSPIPRLFLKVGYI